MGAPFPGPEACGPGAGSLQLAALHRKTYSSLNSLPRALTFWLQLWGRGTVSAVIKPWASKPEILDSNLGSAVLPWASYLNETVLKRVLFIHSTVVH